MKYIACSSYSEQKVFFIELIALYTKEAAIYDNL